MIGPLLNVKMSVSPISQIWIYISSIVLFTKECIMEADVVKGQAVAMALYTMGLALGNYAGGWLIDSVGVNGMLFAALLSAAAGTVVINVTIRKTDRCVARAGENPR